MAEIISSSNNPLVKQIRALRHRKSREESGLFLVEGIHHVGEAIEAGWCVEALVYAPEQLTSDFARHIVDDQTRSGVRTAALTTDLFGRMAEKDNPQGILAMLRQRHLSLGDLDRNTFITGVALVSPQDPGNVGTILRTIDAAGGDGLFLLDGGVDPYHPSCIRASMGTIFWKPFVQVSFDHFTEWANGQGYCLVGSSAHATTNYRAFRCGNQATILLLGNEQKGLSQEQMAVCDISLSIPMNGRVSSLNLAVAAGIMLYTILD